MQRSDKNINKIPTFSYFQDRKIPTFSYFGIKIPTFCYFFDLSYHFQPCTPHPGPMGGGGVPEVGYPPSWTWLGYPPPPGPVRRTPPPPGVDRQMNRHVSKHNLPVVLSTWSVIICLISLGGYEDYKLFSKLLCMIKTIYV